MTRQRRVILEELRAKASHPTADELYARVRRRLPKISLATVYRNLDVLTQQGDVQTLELAGRKKRYDGNPRPHAHVRCVQCGRLRDVPLDSLPCLRQMIADTGDWDVLGERVEFEGLCPACRQESEATDRPERA